MHELMSALFRAALMVPFGLLVSRVAIRMIGPRHLSNFQAAVVCLLGAILGALLARLGVILVPEGWQIKVYDTIALSFALGTFLAVYSNRLQAGPNKVASRDAKERRA